MTIVKQSVFIIKQLFPVWRISLFALLCVCHSAFSSNAVAGTHFDFDGDQKADFAVRRPANFYYFTSLSSDNDTQRVQFGRHEKDIPVSGDFDGDGVTDFGVRRPSNSTWYILNSSGVDRITNHSDGITRLRFGRLATDIPVPADYDGDGKTDIAIRRPGNQTWYIVNSTGIDSVTQHSDGISRIRFGLNEADIPVPADYDGDGKADLAVRRASSQFWYIKNSAGVDVLTGNVDGITRIKFGRQENDIPVVADYDGDGKADIAVRRPSTFQWYVRNSSGVDGLTEHADGISRVILGRHSGDIPVVADYDGDGKADIAVRRPSSHIWYVRNSSGVDIKTQSEDGITRFRFGLETTDIPLASPVQLIWLDSDVDYDGLTNAQEVEYGTDIGLADSDNDGLSDADEINVYQTNPTNPDSDNDGLSDGEEIERGLDPNTPDNPELVVSEAFLSGLSGYLSYGDRVIDDYLESYIDYYVFGGQNQGSRHQTSPLYPTASEVITWSLNENILMLNLTETLESNVFHCSILNENPAYVFDDFIVTQVLDACDKGLLSGSKVEIQSGLTAFEWHISSVTQTTLNLTKQHIITHKLVLPEDIAEQVGSSWIGSNEFITEESIIKGDFEFVYSYPNVMDELQNVGLNGTWAMSLFYELPSGENYWLEYEDDFYHDLVTINGNDAQGELSASNLRVNIEQDYFELISDTQTLRYTPAASLDNSFLTIVERFVNGELVSAVATKLVKRNATAAEFVENPVLPNSFAYAFTSEFDHWLKEIRQDGNIPFTSIDALSFREEGTMRTFSYYGSIEFRVGGQGFVWQSSSELQDTLIATPDPSFRIGRFWRVLGMSSSGRIDVFEYFVNAYDANNDGEFTSDELGFSNRPLVRTLEIVDMSTYSHWNILDFDRDGLSNAQEAEFGTDIDNPDSDDDGFTDGEEWHWGPSDPLDANSKPMLLSEVSFIDSGLASCAEAHMNQHGQKNAVHSLFFLECPGLGISDLSGLENFTGLSRIDFSDNIIIDISPVSGLVYLHTATFNHNQISELSSFAGLENLSNLYVNHNTLTGVSSLNNLPELRNLELQNNQIGHLAGLSELPRLQSLYLDNNDVETVSELMSLENLRSLGLTGNLNVDCDSVYDLQVKHPLLTVIKPAHCPGRTIDFAVIEDAGLAACLTSVNPIVDELHSLDCSDSAIADLSGIEQLYALQTLNINNNSIESLEPVAQLNRLTSLHGDANLISDLQPIASLNISSLSLNDNQITEIDPDGTLSNYMNHLYLKNNLISRIDMPEEDYFWGILELDENQISDIGFISKLDVQSLSIRNNEINDVSPLSGKFIHTIDLSHNPISDFSPLTTLENTANLILANNNISDIEFLRNIPEPPSFLNLADNQITDMSPVAGYTGFHLLNVSGNQINDASFLENYSYLFELDISNNQISTFPVLNLGSAGLGKLNASANLLTEMPAFSVLTSAEELYLDNNRITSIASLTEAESSISRSQLVTVSLNNNQIEETGDFNFFDGRFVYLKNLYLAGNKLTELSAFDDLELTELDLSNNLIESAKISGSWSNIFHSIDLSNNKLTNLDDIDRLWVKHFKLGDNQIRDLAGLQAPGRFKTHIKSMDFRGNALESISAFTSGDFHSLELLDFTANPALDCSQIPHVQSAISDIHIVAPDHCSAE